MFEFANALRGFVHRHWILLVLVTLAIVFYAIGFRRGSTIAIVLAMLFELGFWVRLFKRDRSGQARE